MMDYRVELDGFCGPLDLLLYLVRREEVDILDLPIAKIAAQFLEFLDVLQVLNLDLIGDFIVMASSLIEIKSRLALPGPESAPEIVTPDEDPRADLVRQLLEYKRFKDAAKLLEDQAAEWQQRFPRLTDDRPRGGSNPASDLIKEVELWDLVSALSRVLRKNTEAAPATVLYDETPIGVYIERIKARVLAEERVSFSSFFAGKNSRSQIVGIFLAILELMRHYKFRAEQPQAYNEIWILPPLPAAVADAPAAGATATPGAGEGASVLSTAPGDVSVPLVPIVPAISEPVWEGRSDEDDPELAKLLGDLPYEVVTEVEDDIDFDLSLYSGSADNQVDETPMGDDSTDAPTVESSGDDEPREAV
ncbi:MAG: segregation/condensation protein A [Planctomycetes bacterium]|nr:segregation/condensation protein A [Planctomycetota bacterium]